MYPTTTCWFSLNVLYNILLQSYCQINYHIQSLSDNRITTATTIAIMKKCHMHTRARPNTYTQRAHHLCMKKIFFFNVKKAFLLKTIQFQFFYIFFAIFSSKSSKQIVFFSQYYWKITESNSEEICKWNENMGTKTKWKVYGK